MPFHWQLPQPGSNVVSCIWYKLKIKKIIIKITVILYLYEILKQLNNKYPTYRHDNYFHGNEEEGDWERKASFLLQGTKSKNRKYKYMKN